MAGKTNLSDLVKGMAPRLNVGEYVFCAVNNLSEIDRESTICEFKENKIPQS
ncbi:hypothetical protein H9Q13_01765 [Pontibacter sp. JH31]|uniref:DUF2241 domain-containing protein n=1 Tax=Pontibacter aquaedesilientis TaxID=2766980 RepID=A0ABR7XC60_9BACT|nr:ACT domain-containing protein [Pontibacter aquaedesilientis]MBD1395877.1 hypothetical protein [Pontibacter aquaedesilientis]